MAADKFDIPKHEIETLARRFLPDIQAYFESEEGKREYRQWKDKQRKITENKSDMID